MTFDNRMTFSNNTFNLVTYKDVAEAYPEITSTLKTMVLDWCALTKGSFLANESFKKLKLSFRNPLVKKSKFCKKIK